MQSLKTVEQLQSDGTDVLMKIMSDGEFRVKCTISEQNIQSIYQDEPMVLRSRVDDSSWKAPFRRSPPRRTTARTTA